MSPTGAGLQDTTFLRNNALFQELDGRALSRISEAGRVRRLRAGKHLFRQGDEASNLYVLLAGQIKMTQLTPEGHQVVLRLTGPGETVGPIAAVGGERYPASAQAAEDCRLMAWDSQSMLSLMHEFPQLAINALQIVAGRVREFQDRYRELATERVERRVARALLRLASQTGKRVDEGILVDVALTRQDLAELTGTTRYTVSRMLSHWEQAGIIEASRERVLIRRPHGLVLIAEDLPQP